MPIILNTGFNEKIDEEKARQIGICQYIEKPLNKTHFGQGGSEGAG